MLSSVSPVPVSGALAGVHVRLCTGACPTSTWLLPAGWKWLPTSPLCLSLTHTQTSAVWPCLGWQEVWWDPQVGAPPSSRRERAWSEHGGLALGGTKPAVGAHSQVPASAMREPAVVPETHTRGGRRSRQDSRLRGWQVAQDSRRGVLSWHFLPCPGSGPLCVEGLLFPSPLGSGRGLDSYGVQAPDMLSQGEALRWRAWGFYLFHSPVCPLAALATALTAGRVIRGAPFVLFARQCAQAHP